MIYILTGAIRTGKTSALHEWSKARTDVDGLLCPDNTDGKRYFLKIKSQEIVPLEVEEGSEDSIVSIGNFKFLKSAFEAANEYLIAANTNRDFKYVVIDELGKLELQNKGLHKAAKNLIRNYEFDAHRHLILVVRESLIAKMVKHYQISEYRLIEKIELENLD